MKNAKNMLILNMKRSFFDEILRGEMTKEYRDATPTDVSPYSNLSLWQNFCTTIKQSHMATKEQIKEYKEELADALRAVMQNDGSRFFSEEEIKSALRDPNIGMYIDNNTTPKDLAFTLSM